MASSTFPLLLLLILFCVPTLSHKHKILNNQKNLTLDYYNATCPDFSKIIREIVTTKQSTNPTTAAAVLRVFFHDCMVEGCDASVLVASTAFNSAERDADSNKNLPGDAFDIVLKAKTALELQCPQTVSCADILAQLTRDLIVMVGGPFFPVPLGRKDGLKSNASEVAANLPNVNFTMDQAIEFFKKKGFDTREMVALMGAHTIGFAHCREFTDRLYNYSKETPTDPAYNPKFAEALKNLCKNFSKDAAMSAFNDVLTPSKFDNMYYQNLQRGLGLLKSDHLLVSDPRTKPIVDAFAANQTVFFAEFGAAMQKLGAYEVKTGKEGEVRSRCDHFNSFQN